MIRFVESDGGRAAAGFKGNAAGDCATRAIAIATGLPYRKVFDDLNALAVRERTGKRKKYVSASHKGVFKGTYTRYLESLGWRFVPTMSIGSGCRVHLTASELPKGRIIVSLSRHLAAVIDRVLHDSHDCSRSGGRCVYGYFIKERCDVN